MASTAGTILLKAMPNEALVHVADRLCEADVVEEFLGEDFENIAVAQYLFIIAGRSPELRLTIVTKYDAYGWIIPWANRF